jgi:hypothetical protein
VFVHTCRCIFLIVWIGLFLEENYFKKSFENVFEVLEKEKEIGIYLFSVFGPKARLLSPPFGPAAPSLLEWAEASECFFSFGRGPHNGPAQSAAVASRRAPLSLPPGPACKRCLLPLLVTVADSMEESDAVRCSLALSRTP